MANPGLTKLLTANEKNFTSNAGIKIRQHIYKPLQGPLKLATDGKITLESIQISDEDSTINVEKSLAFLKLKPNTPYIFVSTHSFCEDINAALSIMDRNAYLLLGSTDQLINNPQAYGVWANGVVYVDRKDKESRQNSLLKMQRLIEAGTSVLIFIEGAYNNTENKLVEEFFNGPLVLAKRTGAKIVPLASSRENGSKNIYITADGPIDFSSLSLKEQKAELRDTLASMMFEIWKHHATRLKRAEMTGDIRLKFMEERRSEYLKNPWTKDVWDEELDYFRDKSITRPEDVRASLDKVKVTKDNAFILAPILARREEDRRYDFKDFMHKTWNK